MARSFRICRTRSTRAGIATEDVGLPAMGADALTIHAPDAETALARARQLGVHGRNLIALPTEN